LTVDLDRVCVSPGATIREIIACIDHNRTGIALVVDGKRRLFSTVTDGDIRRAILAGHNLDAPVTDWGVYKGARYQQPVTAPVGADHAALLKLMQEQYVRQLPLLDEQGCVVGLALLRDLEEADILPVTAVIMAGGFGTRLRPLTEDAPKPMLPIANRPILEWIIEGLRQAGIRKVIVTTYYKAEIIRNHLEDGRRFGVQIEYIHEDRLSGTAGALGLVQDWSQCLLVINGDILTRVDFRSMFEYHQEHRADLSMALRQYHFQIPYGVVEVDDHRVAAIREKPTQTFFVNAGIYILSPSVQGYVIKDEFLDMPELIKRLVTDHRVVVGFPVHEYWLDIGQLEQYEQAQNDAQGWTEN
jgi:dTDP-glucose pyrophosphorylase/CBS domain-containing protein